MVDICLTNFILNAYICVPHTTGTSLQSYFEAYFSRLTVPVEKANLNYFD